jgi:DNA-directed RNA polymerase specialized sigma24 family protein
MESPEAPAASDTVLLERIAAGEREALTALLARHQRSLYGLALGILADPEAAAEIVDLVSREVLREARHFSPTHYPVSRWLAYVTRVAALTRLHVQTG